MRIIIARIIIALWPLFFSINVYASSNDSISVVDAPFPAETQPVNISPRADDDRLAACENNMQNLLGRVEVLEHAIKELQNTSGQNVSAQNPMGNVAPDVSGITEQATGSDDKREYDLALAALKESRFADAENLFASFMQKNTHSPLMGNAYFWYAESFYRRGEFDKAAVHYLKGYKQYPKSPKAADNLLKLALALGELKKGKDACAMLNKLDAEYKNRPASSVKRANDAKAKYCK